MGNSVLISLCSVEFLQFLQATFLHWIHSKFFICLSVFSLRRICSIWDCIFAFNFLSLRTLPLSLPLLLCLSYHINIENLSVSCVKDCTVISRFLCCLGGLSSTPPGYCRNSSTENNQKYNLI